MATVEIVPEGLTWAGRLMGIENAVGQIDSPDGKKEDAATARVQSRGVTAGDEILPDEGDQRGVKAQQVEPKPDGRTGARLHPIPGYETSVAGTAAAASGTPLSTKDKIYAIAVQL